MGILRRLREWREDKNGTLIGPDIQADSVDADSLNTDAVDYNGVEPDYLIGVVGGTNETSKQTTTSSTYTSVLDTYGTFDLTDIPDGMSLYGRYYARIGTSDATETVSSKPQLFEPSSGATPTLDELEVSHTGDTDETTVDSGWTEITSNISGIVTANLALAKITGGATATIEHDTPTLYFAGVSN